MLPHISYQLDIPRAKIIKANRVKMEKYHPSEVTLVPLVKDWKQRLADKELLIMPAAIDLHVHFREPGFTHKETMHSGATAAAHGGCTTVLDMPNTDPSTTTEEEIYKKKQQLAIGLCHILIAAGISNSNINQIQSLNRHTDMWKVYLDDSFHSIPCSFDSFQQACQELNQVPDPKPIFVHAMDSQTGHQTIEEEIAGIKKALVCAAQYPNLKFHITHLSCVDAIQVIQEAKLDHVTTDTCPRYFMPKTKIGSFLRCNPPIRNEEEQKKLARAVKKRKINFITTDHAPHTKREKLQNIPGAPGVQELYIQMIDWMLQDTGIENTAVTQLLHYHPQKLILNPKVNLNDKIIVDPTAKTKITKEWIKSKCGWSLYENQVYQGQILAIIRKKTNTS